MSTRAHELAIQFEQANDDFITFISGLSEDEWLRVCPDEERTIAALSYHVAGGYVFEIGAFRGIAEGKDLPVVAKETLDRMNADGGAKFAEADRSETIEKLRHDGAIAAEFVRSLTDDQLQRVGAYIDWVPPMSVEKWIEHVLIGHIRMHKQVCKPWWIMKRRHRHDQRIWSQLKGANHGAESDL